MIQYGYSIYTHSVPSNLSSEFVSIFRCQRVERQSLFHQLSPCHCSNIPVDYGCIILDRRRPFDSTSNSEWQNADVTLYWSLGYVAVWTMLSVYLHHIKWYIVVWAPWAPRSFNNKTEKLQHSLSEITQERETFLHDPSFGHSMKYIPIFERPNLWQK